MPTRDKHLADERRQHLEHLQSAIARMASASSSAKTWFLPVIVATLGYAISSLAFFVALLGLAATVLFAVLDSHYLREERAFRALYSRAAKDDGPVYDMNSRQFYGKANGDDADLKQLNCKWGKVFWSWSVAGFYVPVAGVAVVVIVVVAANLTTGFGSLLLVPPTPSPSGTP